jgi:hypothetical protein
MGQNLILLEQEVINYSEMLYRLKQRIAWNFLQTIYLIIHHLLDKDTDD